MTLKIHTRLTRKYMHAPEVMTDPYSEMREYNGVSHMYLVNGDGNLAILCDAIVDVEVV